MFKSEPARVILQESERSTKEFKKHPNLIFLVQPLELAGLKLHHNVFFVVLNSHTC